MNLPFTYPYMENNSRESTIGPVILLLQLFYTPYVISSDSLYCIYRTSRKVSFDYYIKNNEKLCIFNESSVTCNVDKLYRTRVMMSGRNTLAKDDFLRSSLYITCTKKI